MIFCDDAKFTTDCFHNTKNVIALQLSDIQEWDKASLSVIQGHITKVRGPYLQHQSANAHFSSSKKREIILEPL